MSWETLSTVSVIFSFFCPFPPFRVNEIFTFIRADIGVMVAALIIWKLDGQGRFYADPAVSMAIALIIFASALPMSEFCGLLPSVNRNGEG